MYFEPEDFVSFTITILENGGIQVTANTTVAFWMVSLDITGQSLCLFLALLNIIYLNDHIPAESNPCYRVFQVYV